MRLHAGNSSKLLRRTAADRCKYCGTPIEWFDRYDTNRIPLTPEVPSRKVPERFHWYVSAGVAYPGTDPYNRRYCRMPHPTVCPALEHRDLPPEVEEVVTRLGVRMRTRIASGEFHPAPVPAAEEEVEEPEPEVEEADDPTRHTIHYAGKLRLAPCRIEDVQCIAALEDGERCPQLIYDRDEGSWEQLEVPHPPGRQGQMILSETGGVMWVWTLKAHNFSIVTRWFTQRCPSHEGDSNAPDSAAREWVDFHPLRHSDFIVTERPQGYDPPPPTGGLTIHDGPRNRRQCANDGCHNGTLTPGDDDWICWQCTQKARRRAHAQSRRKKSNYPR